MTDHNAYDDIIDLPHHQSKRHPQMSMRDRAAQFAPFAALTGFDGVIAETGRETQQRVELSESETENLNRTLSRLDERARSGERPKVTVVYFLPDARKDGGMYTGYTGQLKRVDAAERLLVFFSEDRSIDGKTIPIDDVLKIHSEKKK